MKYEVVRQESQQYGIKAEKSVSELESCLKH